MKQYLKYVLPFLCVIFGYITHKSVFNHHTMLTKNEFYAKHHIENNTLSPSSFDEMGYRQALMEVYNNNNQIEQSEVEYIIELLKQSMMPPEQFEGFYPPQPKVRFYNAVYKDNLLKLGLSLQDIKDLDLVVTDEMVREWHMDMTIQQLEKEGFYTIAKTAQLVAKVGDNIYLTGFYTDCGTSGCPVNIMVKEQEKWHSKKADILFDFCAVNEHRTVYECNFVGGHNELWHYVADYASLADLSNRYYEVWHDYVEQYIQRDDR